MEKLKPCPFCGSEMVLRYSKIENPKFVFFHKEVTNCMFFFFTVDEDPYDISTFAQAVEGWNKRAHNE